MGPNQTAATPEVGPDQTGVLKLGHTDLRMLQQHYRHRIKRTVDGANAVDGLLNTNPPT